MARKKYLEEEEEDSYPKTAQMPGEQKQRHVLGSLSHPHPLAQSHSHPIMIQKTSGVGNGSGTGNGGDENHVGGGRNKGSNNNSGGNPRNPKHNPSVSVSDLDGYSSVQKQLGLTGLTIREMPGDGNCLFRALADQLEGHTRNHLDHRRAVVQYMKDNRSDFEPFVEDDEPFEKYVQTLSQPGTFAGNDAIVAFSRLHNVTVVIHQLNSPTWLIHPSNDPGYVPSGREVHIAYHNGDHYNSVRKIGDDSDSPSNIKLGTEGKSGKMSPPHSSSRVQQLQMQQTQKPGLNANPFPFHERDEDYWVKDQSDIERLVDEVIAQTDYPDRNFVRETLMEFNFDMVSTLDFILSISYLMSEPQDPEPSEKEEKQCKEETKQVDIRIPPEVVNAEDEQEYNNKQNEALFSNSSSDNKEAEDPDLSPIQDENLGIDIVNMNEVLLTGSTSQNVKLNGSANSKAKLSCRQKKELKKRERKREADRRKSENPSRGSSDTLNISSNTAFGSLNI